VPALGFPESSYRSHLVDFERTISSGEARYRLAGRIESGGSSSSVVRAKFDRDQASYLSRHTRYLVLVRWRRRQ